MKKLYVVMGISTWDNMEIATDGVPCRSVPQREDPNGVIGFLPVFKNKRKAERFAGKNKIQEVAVAARE